MNVKLNEQFSWKAYGRYSVEDYARTLNGVNYSDNQSFRVGVSGEYIVSQDLALNAGVNYIMQGFENPLNGVIAPNFDENLLNIYLGFTLGLTDTVSLNGRYNFEDLSSDAGRDYDRNRFSLGVSAQF